MSQITRLSVICIMMLISTASAFEFRVGGVRGWTKPTGQESESYNQWAGRNRFHIRDSLYFKYTNDSVLVVNKEEYANCNTSNPVLSFNDGNTTFTFTRHGYFYFVSGVPGHCEAGEKLVVRVMVHPVGRMGPAQAPYSSGDGASSYSGYGPGPSTSPKSSGAAVLKAGVGFGSVLALLLVMFI